MIHFHNTDKGFTLLEMLVATTILVIMLVISMGAVNSASNLASQGTQRIDANRVAREALDEIGREISKAAVPWNRLNTTNSVQFFVDPPSTLLPANAVKNSDSIFWQAPVANNRDFGNLAIIGYFVMSDTTSSTNSANWRLQLRRMYIEPETSGSTANPNYLLYSGSNLTTATGTSTWLNSTTTGTFAPSTTAADVSNAMEGWAADGVLAMWVRCLDKSGDPIVTNATTTPASMYPEYNSSMGYVSSGTTYSASGTYNTFSYPATNYAALPAFVEVNLVCMSPGEMGRLRSIPAVTAFTAATFSTPAAFYNGIQSYVTSVRTANPGVKSVEAFSRRFRIYSSD